MIVFSPLFVCNLLSSSKIPTLEVLPDRTTSFFFFALFPDENGKKNQKKTFERQI